MLYIDVYVGPRSYISLRSGAVSFSFFLLTTLRHPGLPGMHPHCSNLASLCSVFCLSKLRPLALFLPVFAPPSLLLSISNWSLFFAIVLLVIVLKTLMLFGKPSGALSAAVVFLLTVILIPDQFLSFAAVFVVGLKALMSFVDIQMEVL